ncbi:flagellar biosynthesis anti-sigma factor FlgM [Endozoicomonas sp. (ex Bugula neritina AB1)]|nr:flagellar biosynthesis anti-sigma factor FlgM [Endozoicomonas sp. (ex Bugula neritina AB1)]
MAFNMTTITSLNRSQPLKTSANKKSEPGAATTPTTQDQVEISNTTTLMTEAEDIALNTPDINETAVANAKEAIENGTMNIDYDRLAQKMLDLEFTLFDS